MSLSRLETLLEALVNGETVDIVPQSRIEAYLLALLNGESDVKEPRSRIEAYLYQLCKRGISGGDEPSVNKLAQLADRSITEVTAEDLAGATKIANYAFNGCQALKAIIIPDSVTSIGYEAFYNCAGLTSIEIPDSVTKIDSSAFYSCSNVKSVTIGNSVANIGYTAFANALSLSSVTVKAETPPILDSTAFRNVPSDCAFYVPAASVEAYKAATNWSARADYIFPIEE